MNRRHFLAAALPALLGGTALKATADNTPQSKPSPRRIKIDVSLPPYTFKPGDSNTHTITVVTNEGVETYAAFTQTHSFQVYQADKKAFAAAVQEIGPSLTVTPHINDDGTIHLNFTVQMQQAQTEAVPANQPLPTVTQSVTTGRNVKSGQAISLGGYVVDNQPKLIQVTATLL